MALDYKIEFCWDNESPSDAGVYIQLRVNTPIYKRRITKEDYDVLPENQKHPFLTGLFTIAGVVEVSSMAYRVWLMKATAYQWGEVLNAVLYFFLLWYKEDTLHPMLGSAEPDGSGFTLNKPVNRRPL